ncbi:MAG: hypothetical protein DRZ82_05050 [Thermoprotei archaeon]|mgnify:FL=1|nr:MAG: hypothetical protein DRZ82_05050 [Thermoprotei archaeon]
MNQKHGKVLMLIVIAGFFAILGSTMSKSPTLPLYAKKLGLSDPEIGVVAAASTITGIVVNFVSGLLSDIYGRKRLLVVSGMVFFSAPLLYFLAKNTLTLASVRAYYGLATAIFVPVSLALVSDLYPSRKGTFMGLLSSATLIGRALAPTIAGTLIYLYGFSPVFILCSATGLTALLLMSTLPTKERKGERPKLSFKFVISPWLLPIGLIDAIVYMAYQGIETFLPLFQVLKEREWLAGLILTTEVGIMALVKPIGGYLSDRIGRIKPIVLGLLLLTCSTVLLAKAGTIPLILASVILFAIAASITTASTKPLATDIARYSGAALGLLESIKDIGQALGPIIVSIANISMGYIIIGILSIIGLVIFLVTMRYLGLDKIA